MEKQVCTGIWILLIAAFIAGCSNNVNAVYTKGFETSGQTDSDSLQTASQQLQIQQVIDRITQEYGLDRAQDYENKIEDMSKDAVVLLCRSESGKYTAYGFISPEYGQKGILIDQVIDGESNWNYFYEYTWEYGNSKPTFIEQGEYDVVFTFTQEKEHEQTIYFESFDTGTMSVKE